MLIMKFHPTNDPFYCFNFMHSILLLTSLGQGGLNCVVPLSCRRQRAQKALCVWAAMLRVSLILVRLCQIAFVSIPTCMKAITLVNRKRSRAIA